MGKFYLFLLLCLLARSASAQWWYADPDPGSVTANLNCSVLVHSVVPDRSTLEGLSEEDSESTVRWGTPQRGKSGGRRYPLTRFGKLWSSSHFGAPQAPQGDPRWLIEMLGISEAEFFGFKMVNSRTLLVPDAEEYNGAIRMVNRFLGKRSPYRIKASFYEAGPRVSIPEYNQNFRNLRLPFAPPGPHRTHDISFHAGLIFLDNEVAEHAAYLESEVDLFANSFRSWLRNKAKEKNASAEQLAEVNYLALLIKSVATIQIDIGTAVVTIAYIEDLKKKLNPNLHIQSSFPFATDTLFFIKSDGALLNTANPLVDKMIPGSGQYAVAQSLKNFREAGKLVSAPRVEKNQKAIEPLFGRDFEPEIDDFFRSYLRRRSDANPRFTAPPPVTAEEGCRRTLLKIAAIRDAVRDLISLPWYRRWWYTY